MTPRLLDTDAVDRLRACALRFGPEAAARKREALATCASGAITDPAVLIAYHDCLLCLVAHPESRAQLASARAELRRVATAARRMVEDGPARARARLANSGIAWTDVTISFGWQIARWLAMRFPAHADIDSFGEGGVVLQSILCEALAPMEFELAASDARPCAFLDAARASGRGTRLAWLVRALERMHCGDTLREALFDTLQAYIVIRPRGSMLSRTFVRGLGAPTYFHRDGLLRNIDLATLVDEPLAAPRGLSASDRTHIVDAGRAMLAALGRETDAIALAHPKGVAWHDLGRGIAIALYTMRPDRRSPLDSHIGMMLFKNGVPVGYGGGWPFLGTCRIGVNIFAPFRGGESALLFGQVLRVYRQRFAVGRFVAEPSQFGGTNKEGLQSGAFWFYYRLGFRPVEHRPARLAAEEWVRMQADPGYRTPVPALRRFTGSDIELCLGDVPDCESSWLSDAVTDWIRERHQGDRTVAVADAERTAARVLGALRLDRWTENERHAFRGLAPLVALIPDLPRWPGSAKRALVALIRAKGGDEFRFHALIARHPRLRDALVALAARQAAR